MAADFYLGQHDTKPVLRKQLFDADGNNPNLTGCTVVFIMAIEGTTPKVNRGACTITDAINAWVQYAWVVGDSDTAEEYRGEFEVTDSGGGVETFPDPEKMTIVVTADLG